MKLRVTENHKFLQVQDCTSNELEQLQFSLTRKVDNWYILRKKLPHWDGDVKFIDSYSRIPIGLWREVQKLAEKFHFQLDVEGTEYLYDKGYDESLFIEWVNEYFIESEKIPRDYQIEGSSRILKYMNCTEEISTSGGKTMMAFMVFRYMLEKNLIKSMLYVVPNINLVTQTEEKFYEYEEGCGKRPVWKSACVFGGAKKSEAAPNIVFGTFQSLSKKEIDYFKDFDAVCVDETHHARAASIKSILIKCCNARYKFGLTGTLPKEGTCDSFTVQSYLGPKVYSIYSADLIAAGNATPVEVVGIELDYLEPEIKKNLYNLRNVSADEKDGAKLLTLEKDVARSNRKRLLYVCDKIANTTKNSLVLFSDIKNEYGRTVYNWLRENTNKTIYYIDGGTKNENRDYYKKQMEEQENTIIVASVGTFGEGIDILNIFSIFIIESHKSEFVIRQILGRGMRLLEGKEKITVVDFRDNFEHGSGYQKKNYLMRHADARNQIYKDKMFPFKNYKVKL